MRRRDTIGDRTEALDQARRFCTPTLDPGPCLIDITSVSTALAIAEEDATRSRADRDFARFPALRWRDPLDG